MLATVLALSVGQVLFKLAASHMQEHHSLVQGFILNPYMVAAAVVYGGATIVWVSLLRQVPLQVAYPFVALAFFFVPIMGYFVLHEPVRWQTLAGALVIMVGIWISVGSD